MKTCILILLIVFTIHDLLLAQKCEDFDRSLFHILPDTLPNKINCIDSLGLKQGWWIEYIIKYNSADIPDALKQGRYVEEYSFGKYKNDKKTGTWSSIWNTHMVYEIRSDEYYYSNDTVMITSKYSKNTWNKSTLYYNSDSSIIKSTSLSYGNNFPICIDCNRERESGKECLMFYRNKKVKEFSFENFEIEFNRSFTEYERDKKIINGENDSK